jgi:hypothetical protein
MNFEWCHYTRRSHLHVHFHGNNGSAVPRVRARAFDVKLKKREPSFTLYQPSHLEGNPHVVMHLQEPRISCNS